MTPGDRGGDAPDPVTGTSLPDAFTNVPYEAQVARTGGSNGAIWSIVSGSSWMTIDPATGRLGGMPPAPGQETVTIRVSEPTQPWNQAEATFTVDIHNGIYFENFETCPANWTFGLLWACGAPTSGPMAPWSGTNLIATNLAGNYPTNVTWDTATAPPPSIALPVGVQPTLSVWAWQETETNWDGFVVQVSTDGGAAFPTVTSVSPAYEDPVGNPAGERPAWTGTKRTWRRLTADRSAWAGQNVVLRFDFFSDRSNVGAGVYIDDVAIYH